MNRVQVKSDGYGGGIGPIDVIQICLIILKLVHVIEWSWFIVLLPCIVCLGLGAVLIITILVLRYQRLKKKASRSNDHGKQRTNHSVHSKGHTTNL